MFLWFYCLEIVDLMILLTVLVGTGIWLDFLLHEKKYWKPLVLGLCAVWLVLVLKNTLLTRSFGNPAPAVWEPLASYKAVLSGGNREILRSNLMNMLLFFPAGFAAALAVSEKHRVWKLLGILLGLSLLSLGIELTQFRLGCGIAETDDVLHNTLGAVMGAAAAGIALHMRRSGCKFLERER